MAVGTVEITHSSMKRGMRVIARDIVGGVENEVGEEIGIPKSVRIVLRVWRGYGDV